MNTMFKAEDTGTRMRDVFAFTSPLGMLGRLADALVLKEYLLRFLVQRGAVLKQTAEGEGWQKFL